MSELLTIVVEGRTAQEAQEAARKWAVAEPGIRLRKITRVRPAAPAPGNEPDPEQWAVELVYVAVSSRGS